MARWAAVATFEEGFRRKQRLEPWMLLEQTERIAFGITVQVHVVSPITGLLQIVKTFRHERRGLVNITHDPREFGSEVESSCVVGIELNHAAHGVQSIARDVLPLRIAEPLEFQKGQTQVRLPQVRVQRNGSANGGVSVANVLSVLRRVTDEVRCLHTLAICEITPNFS